MKVKVCIKFYFISPATVTLESETSSVVELKIESPLLDEVYNISIVATAKESGQKANDFGLAYLERKVINNFSYKHLLN
jgi:hypothetical protein